MSRSDGSKWLQSLARLSQRLGALVEGPRSQIRLGASDAVWIKRHPGRPIALCVEQDAILSSRLTLPRLSSRQVLSAARLMLESETPFNFSELLVAIRARGRNQADQRVAYDVFAVPRSAIDESLAKLKITAGRVDAVHSADGGISDGRVWFAWGRRRSRWLNAAWVALPFLLISAGLAWSAATMNARWNLELERLGAAQDLALAETRRLQSQITEAEARSSEQAQVSALLAQPSIYVALNDLKKSLPSEVVVSALNLRDGEISITVKSRSVLETVAQLNAAGLWAVAIDGGIAADPASGGETATLRLVLR